VLGIVDVRLLINPLAKKATARLRVAKKKKI